MQFVAKHSNQSRLALVSTLLILIAVSLLPVSVVAHDAGTFTILVKESGPTPNNPQLVYNDSAWWYNVDSRENITHRIVWDSDGDGLYNGTLDWDSGNMSYECETDENGTKLDDDCRVTYEIPFNGTWGVGTYEYQDISSDGTITNGTIVVISDVHIEDGNTPPPGYEFGNDGKDTDQTSEDDTQEDSAGLIEWIKGLFGGISNDGNDDETQEPQSDENEEERNWLLWLAGASGVLSVLLIGLLLAMRTSDSMINADEENEVKSEKINSDSDIKEIAEEE